MQRFPLKVISSIIEFLAVNLFDPQSLLQVHKSIEKLTVFTLSFENLS